MVRTQSPSIYIIYVVIFIYNGRQCSLSLVVLNSKDICLKTWFQHVHKSVDLKHRERKSKQQDYSNGFRISMY